jgi:hypothetical protein
MNKASSALLATAGVTVGLLGFALPAGAAVSAPPGGPTPVVGQPPSGPANGPTGPANGPAGPAGPRGPSDNGPAGPRGDGPQGGPTGPKGNGPTGQPDPCPTRTHKPCPPKPCEVVVIKPCKHKWDKGGWLAAHREQAKRVYVCKPKPCPTKPKPCPPKCKKHQPHKHPCHNKGTQTPYYPGLS